MNSRSITNRRGFSLVEMMATALVVGCALTLVIEIAAASKLQQREADRRSLAQLECANAMERVSAMPWSKLPESGTLDVTLSETAQKSLPHAVVKVDVSSVPATTDAPAAKKVLVELTWHDRHGQAIVPVRLVKWLYRVEGESP